jgi:predicted O-methyltransferase YrrM
MMISQSPSVPFQPLSRFQLAKAGIDLLGGWRALLPAINPKRLLDRRSALAELHDLLGWPAGTLSLSGGWTAKPDFLLLLARHVAAHRPAVVLELGAGATTRVLARALALAGGGTLVSVDHHPDYLNEAVRTAHSAGVRIQPVLAPLVRSPHGAVWYDLTGWHQPIDLLVIDGPPAIGHGADVRGGAARLFDALAPGATVMLDDAARPGEQAVAVAWAASHPHLAQSFVRTQRGTLMLAAPPARALAFAAE